MTRIHSQEDAIKAAENDSRLTSVDNTGRKYEGPTSVLEEYNDIESIRTTVTDNILIIDSPNDPKKFDKF